MSYYADSCANPLSMPRSKQYYQRQRGNLRYNPSTPLASSTPPKSEALPEALSKLYSKLYRSSIEALSKLRSKLCSKLCWKLYPVIYCPNETYTDQLWRLMLDGFEPQ